MLRTIDPDEPHSLFDYFYVGRYKDTNTDVKSKTLLRFDLEGIQASDIDNAYLVLIVDLDDGLTQSSSGEELTLEIHKITTEWDWPSWNNQPIYAVIAEEKIMDSDVRIEVTELVRSLANGPNNGIMLKDKDENLPGISNNMKQFSTDSYIEINGEDAPPVDQPPIGPPPGDGGTDPGTGGTGEPPADDGGTEPVLPPGDATGSTEEVTYLLQNCLYDVGVCATRTETAGVFHYETKQRSQCDETADNFFRFEAGQVATADNSKFIPIGNCNSLTEDYPSEYCRCGYSQAGLICHIPTSSEHLGACSQIMDRCVDEDGEDITQKKSVTTYSYENGEEIVNTYEDGCDGLSVKEAVCNGNNLGYKTVECLEGQTCIGAVCVESECSREPQSLRALACNLVPGCHWHVYKEIKEYKGLYSGPKCMTCGNDCVRYSPTPTELIEVTYPGSDIKCIDWDGVNPNLPGKVTFHNTKTGEQLPFYSFHYDRCSFIDPDTGESGAAKISISERKCHPTEPGNWVEEIIRCPSFTAPAGTNDGCKCEDQIFMALTNWYIYEENTAHIWNPRATKGHCEEETIENEAGESEKVMICCYSEEEETPHPADIKERYRVFISTYAEDGTIKDRGEYFQRCLGDEDGSSNMVKKPICRNNHIDWDFITCPDGEVCSYGICARLD